MFDGESTRRFMVRSTSSAPCGLRGCKNRAWSISWPEVIKRIPNQGIDCFVSCGSFLFIFYVWRVCGVLFPCFWLSPKWPITIGMLNPTHSLTLPLVSRVSAIHSLIIQEQNGLCSAGKNAHILTLTLKSPVSPYGYIFNFQCHKGLTYHF